MYQYYYKEVALQQYLKENQNLKDIQCILCTVGHDDVMKNSYSFYDLNGVFYEIYEN